MYLGRNFQYVSSNLYKYQDIKYEENHMILGALIVLELL